MQKYEKQKKYRHMEVQEEKEKNRDTWRSQGIGKNEHMKAHKKKKEEEKMIAMSQNKKLERYHSYKRSIV